jgi:hypothetical protein
MLESNLIKLGKENQKRQKKMLRTEYMIVIKKKINYSKNIFVVLTLTAIRPFLSKKGI